MKSSVIASSSLGCVRVCFTSFSDEELALNVNLYILCISSVHSTTRLDWTGLDWARLGKRMGGVVFNK
jgi:hypothetical protein